MYLSFNYCQTRLKTLSFKVFMELGITGQNGPMAVLKNETLIHVRRTIY